MDTTATEQKTWTILSLVNWSVQYFEAKEIDSPRLTAELLLSRVLECSRMDLYTSFDKPLFSEDLAKYKLLVQRRIAREPLQYILGETEFMGLRFRVDSRVLIPRPETEILVEHAIRLAKEDPTIKKIIDIGTGSGNIAVSLAKFLENVHIDAVDCSTDALVLATENACSQNVEQAVKYFSWDILSESLLERPALYDMIVSNPPYISKEEFSSLEPEVREYEPQIATTDKHDGLTFYRAIAAFGVRSLRKRGYVCLELGYSQAEEVTKIFLRSGYDTIEVIPDYNKIQRVFSARRS